MMRRQWIGLAALALLIASSVFCESDGVQKKAGGAVALEQQVRVHSGKLKYILLDGVDANGFRISSEKNPSPAFEVVQKPSHGTLHGEPPRVIYTPADGFRGQDRFAFTVTTGSVRSRPATVTLDVRDWTPPIGIPAPDFGIAETHAMYGGGGATPYSAARHGPYTHYVDNTHTAATDDGNDFGSPEKPRRTIPLTLGAGSVVEVHGGPYVFPRDRVRFVAKGTAARPVFLRATGGAERVRLEVESLEIAGTYAILENFELKGATVSTSHRTPTDHVVIRNCEIHHHRRSNAVNAGGRNIVIFNNYIHHIGDHDNPNDRHGLHARAGSEKVWFLDNRVHHCTGDGTQFAHGARNNNEPRFVHVGRNIFHDNLENAVDIKYASDVIISQNTCYGFRPVRRGKSGSDGTAVVLGSDGGPKRVWVIFNTIWDSTNAIRNEETVDAWIIGNVIHDIQNGAIVLEKRGTNLRIVNNTIVRAAVAVNQPWKPHFGFHMAGNIVAGIGENKYGNHFNIESAEVSGRSSLSHNLFWQDGAPLILLWGARKVLRIAAEEDFASFAGGKGNIFADPRFRAPARRDFRLSPGSPAIDRGVIHHAYEEFEKLYGASIRVDHDGVPRPQGKAWDMGAFEMK